MSMGGDETLPDGYATSSMDTHVDVGTGTAIEEVPL
jgi:hypothetical protein